MIVSKLFFALTLAIWMIRQYLNKRMVMNGSNDVSVNDGILQFVQHLLETFHARGWAKVEHVINSNPEYFRAISASVSKMTQLNQMTM